MKKIIFFSIIAFSLSLQALPHSEIEEPGERNRQDTGISNLKQEVLSHQTIQAVIPEQSELERDLVERLEKARKSGDRETSRTLLLELDAIHGIVTLPPKTSSDISVESGGGLVANIESLQMLSGDIRVNPLSEDAVNPSLVSTPEGILFVAAEDRASGVLNIYRSDNNGNNWTWELVLSGGGLMNPSSAYLVDPNDGVGYVYIAFEGNSNSSGTNRYVYVFRFAVADISNRSFFTVENGITMGGADDHLAPEIISDYEQYPHEPWLYITYSTFGSDYYPVYHSRSTDYGTSWSTPTNITGGAENSSFPGHPDITFKGSYVYVAFNKLGWNGSAWKTQVWVAISSDLGGSWSTPVQLTAQFFKCIRPRIEAAQDNNSIMVGWVNDFGGNGLDYDIAYHYSINSGASWNFGGSISNTSEQESGFELAHSAGKFHIAYHMDNMLRYKNIATSDIDDWTKWTNPVQVDDNSGKVSEWYPWPGIAVPPNSNEKACFAWSDFRNDGANYDIYFNRVITTEFLPAVIMYLLD